MYRVHTNTKGAMPQNTSKQSSFLEGSQHCCREGSKNQGRANPAFSKPCLCLSDTRHFRHFRRFRGSEWVECKFVIFVVFVKTAPSSMKVHIALQSSCFSQDNSWGSEMPWNILFLRPQNRSRLKPYYSSTTTAVKVFGRGQNTVC